MNATQYVVADSVTILAAGFGAYKLFKNGNHFAGAALAAVAALNVYYLVADVKQLNGGSAAAA